MKCSHCSSEDIIYLGVLGKYVWTRCRDCGLDKYTEAPPCFAVTEEALVKRSDYLNELYGGEDEAL